MLKKAMVFVSFVSMLGQAHANLEAVIDLDEGVVITTDLANVESKKNCLEVHRIDAYLASSLTEVEKEVVPIGAYLSKRQRIIPAQAGNQEAVMVPTSLDSGLGSGFLLHSRQLLDNCSCVVLLQYIPVSILHCSTFAHPWARTSSIHGVVRQNDESYIFCMVISP